MQEGLSQEQESDDAAAEHSELSRRIYDSYVQFLEDVRAYHRVSEQAYIDTR